MMSKRAASWIGLLQRCRPLKIDQTKKSVRQLCCITGEDDRRCFSLKSQGGGVFICITFDTKSSARILLRVKGLNAQTTPRANRVPVQNQKTKYTWPTCHLGNNRSRKKNSFESFASALIVECGVKQPFHF